MSVSLTEYKGARPNVVIVVLDCVRADAIDAMSQGPSPQLSFIQWLRKEATSFPHTATPSAWTIPSHASLFTGLHPWEHRVHYKSSLQLSPSIPTLAGTLRKSGYATFSASANGFLSPSSGLLNGFDSAAWGEPWERLIRISGNSLPTSGVNCGPTLNEPFSGRLATIVPDLGFKGFADLAMDAANYFASRVRDPATEFYPTNCAWIEPTLERWLGRQNPQTPVFSFINLYDAHEPYFLPPDLRREPGTWAKFLRSRIDGTGFLAGHSALDPEKCQMQYRVYRSILAQLDRRVRALVDTLRRTGRWENTIFVLTSDHGQCFGEHSYIFHERRLWEPIARIPLYVRFPQGRLKGVEATGWASLVDVYPTVLDVTEISAPRPRAGYSLEQLVTAPRPSPAWSIADGIFRSERSVRLYGSLERANYWDHVLVAGYSGSTKVIMDATSGQFEYHDVDRDPSESVDLSRTSGYDTYDLVSMATVHGQMLLRASATAPSEEVSQRLRSWGY
jgi:arylsulfatase A-like enzyme